MKRRQRALHIREVHLKISYDCEKCGKSFKEPKSIKQHMQKVHMKEGQKKRCHICEEWCKDHETLATHMRRHTGRRFNGNIFGLSFGLNN